MSRIKFDTEKFFSLPHHIGDYIDDSKNKFCAFGAHAMAIGLYVEREKYYIRNNYTKSSPVGFAVTYGLPRESISLVTQMNDGKGAFEKCGPQPHKARILLYKLLKKYDLIDEGNEIINLPIELRKEVAVND